MPGVTVSDLPAPPPGRDGWPWTEGSPQLPDTMPDGSPWPRVSIVTPSFNQGQFIEETIRSVLLQGYPDVEYFIVDGGSTDDSVDIIRKYEPWVAAWLSEPDRGQSHALNKGFSRCTGEVLAWLNSDDSYTPGALGCAVGRLWREGASVLYGRCRVIYASTGIVTEVCPDLVTFDTLLLKQWLPANIPAQPAVFFRRAAFEASGGQLDESLHYAMDYDLWLRLARNHSFIREDQILAKYPIHKDSKSGQGFEVFQPEFDRVYRRHAQTLSPWQYLAFRCKYRREIAQRFVADAFKARMSAHKQVVRRSALRAFLNDPSTMRNLGLLGLFLDSSSPRFASLLRRVYHLVVRYRRAIQNPESTTHV